MGIFSMKTDAVISQRGLWLLRAMVMLAVVLHAALVLVHFNPRLQFGQGRPLISGDLSFHFASAMEGVEFLRERHVLWGYSPSYMAGYPFGIWNSMPQRGYEIAASFLPFTSPEVAYDVFIVVAALATPLVLLLACSASGIERPNQWLVLLLALWLFHFDNQITYFWTFGNIVFPLVAALAVVFTALVSTPRIRLLRVLGAGLLLGAIFWLHPLGLIPAALGGVAAIGFSPGRRLALALRLVLVGVIAAAVASPWLIPLLKFRDLRSPMAVFPLQADLRNAVMDLFSDRAYRLPFDRRATLHVLLVLAVLGASASYRARRFGPVAFFAAGLALFALTYTVGYVPTLKQLQPYRFMIAYEWFWVIPAAVGVGVFLSCLRETNADGRIVAASLALAILPSLTAYGFDFLARHPARGLDANEMACVERIKADGTGAGRVLCDDLALGNMIPYLTKREVIGGGLSSQAVIRNGWACVDEQRAFGHPLAELSSDQLARYLSLYNITRAIVRSDVLKARFADLPRICSQIGEFGPLTLFAVKPERMETLWEGVYEGRVQAEPDRIVIRPAPHGKFTINYHYFRTLKAGESVAVRPVYLLDDPVPFIQVENSTGQEQIIITNNDNYILK
jgi:hypothetical protein